MRFVVPLISVCAMTVALAEPQRPGSPNPRALILQSTDVAYLEQIAMQEAVARQFAQTNDWQAKSARSQAYVRLGAIGTLESLAAIGRIEAAVRALPPLSTRPITGDVTHPADHMGDRSLQSSLSQAVRAPNGLVYAIEGADMLGPGAPFLLIRGGTGWSHPRLAGDALSTRPWFPMTLAAIDATHLRIDFGPAPIQDGVQQPGPPPRVLVLADVMRDTDSDGWTDAEEALLGTDPKKADSDSDGIPDGADVCPLYRPAPNERDDDDARVIERALFAAYGLTASPWALFVDPGSQKLQLHGFPGPVLFDRALPPGSIGNIGVYVRWRIASRSESDAVVLISDWEGNMAGSTEQITLRRINGAWFVVERKMLSIS